MTLQTQDPHWLLTQLHCPLRPDSGHLPAKGSLSNALRPQTLVCSHTQPFPKLAARSFARQLTRGHQAVPAPPVQVPQISVSGSLTLQGRGI